MAVPCCYHCCVYLNTLSDDLAQTYTNAIIQRLNRHYLKPILFAKRRKFSVSDSEEEDGSSNAVPSCANDPSAAPREFRLLQESELKRDNVIYDTLDRNYGVKISNRVNFERYVTPRQRRATAKNPIASALTRKAGKEKAN